VLGNFNADRVYQRTRSERSDARMINADHSGILKLKTQLMTAAFFAALSRG